MELTLQQIADATGGVVEGDPGRRVARACTPEAVAPDGLCIVFGAAAAARPEVRTAAACLAPPGLALEGLDVVRVADPRAALVVVLERLSPRRRLPPGVHPDATVADGARLGAEVAVGPGARIAAGVRVGDRVEIHANVVIGEEVVIGDDCLIHPNATLLPGTRLGDRVIVHSGVVIGSDGFGYHLDDDGRCRKIPQVGGVLIEDDVEIGAGTTVDRGTIDPTVIRRGSKIDNQVQIAHNCVVGADCCLVAQVGILDHVRIASGARVAAGSGVIEDLGPGTWLGSPALPNLQGGRVVALLARLPEMRNELRALRRRCERLERELAKGAADPGPAEG